MFCSSRRHTEPPYSRFPSRWPLRIAILAMVGVMGILPTSPCAGAPVGKTDRAPNVIVIFADDLGYGELSCQGHAKFKTPMLDRMAAEGARLTDFYVPVPYCAPSRGTIMTGRYPWRHGVIRNPCPDAGIDDVGIKLRSPVRQDLFCGHFDRHGFTTSAI